MSQTKTYTTPKNHTYQTTNDSFKEVFAGEYECDLIEPPKTVLDIGANEGAFTAWALEKWPDCTIEAFEPVPTNAELFIQNHPASYPADHSGRATIRFVMGAIAKDSEVTLFTGGYNSGEASVYMPDEMKKDEVKAVGIKPESLISAEFVKIDTEGCEVPILAGLDLTNTKALALEYHRDSDRALIIGAVTGAGLELIDIIIHGPNRGTMKFAKEGASTRKKFCEAARCVPDETPLTGTTKDGVTVSLTAGEIRNETYRTELKGKKLFIGIAVNSQMTVFTVQSLQALQANKPCPIVIDYACGDGVARARNMLTTAFLKTDCTHLLFLDYDLIFSVDHIVNILTANEHVVGGFYPKKQQGPLEWCINTLNPHPPVREDHLQALRFVGTGFLCIERSVFAQMQAVYPENTYREDYGARGMAHDFWSMGVYRPELDDAIVEAEKLARYFDKQNHVDGLPSSAGAQHDSEDMRELVSRLKFKLGKDVAVNEGRYLSEDWYFCQRWNDMGGTCYGHTGVMLKHVGQVIFPLNTQAAEVVNPLPR